VKRAILVANPVSGAHRAAALVPRLVEAFAERGIAARPVWTTADDRDPAVDAEILGSELAVAIGGDGTLSRVARPIILSGRSAEAAPAIAFFAAGTGNVALRALRLPRTPGELAEAVVADRCRRLDVGVIPKSGATGRRENSMLLWAGAGWDGALIHAVAQSRAQSRGLGVLWRYVREAPGVIARQRFEPITVEVDGRSFTGSSAIVCNIGELAFGRATGRAIPDDGVFDVVVSRIRSRTALVVTAALAVAIPFDRLPGFLRTTGRRFRLAGATAPVQIDGEAAGVLPFEVEIRPASLRLIAPASPSRGGARRG
jgi:diacylglycerol kinase family enzyme